ncbi:hypothetical protein, partial [Klebsiella pneumoniae]|uniref:hypothetical protein n=1 Tax=Klebsiella pneumoniae TaxID=573 RepID=UPI003531A84F
MTIIAWTSFLGGFRNPLLPHFLSDVICFFFLFIFNSTTIHAVLSKMTKFSTSKTSFGGISFSHVMFYTIHSNVSKFSTIMTSAPGV